MLSLKKKKLGKALFFRCFRYMHVGTVESLKVLDCMLIVSDLFVS